MPDRNWTILVVEAEQPAQVLLAGCLQKDYQVPTTTSGQAAFDILADNEVDLVLCDLVLSDISGVEFFSHIGVAIPETMRVLLTDCLDEVIRSINEAAVYRIMSRTWQSDQLRLLIRRALENRELARLHRYLSRELKFADEVLRQQNRKMTTQLQSAHEFDKLGFASDSMIEVCNLARLAAATDLPVLIQGETGTGCHLEADMLARGVQQLDPAPGSVVLIENVGNLVCPALFDLGERAKVVVLSVIEGEDKPAKYPHMFRACRLMLLNKIDLLSHVRFDVDRCVAYAREINPDIEVLQVSAETGEGMEAWYDWLRHERAHQPSLVSG